RAARRARRYTASAPIRNGRRRRHRRPARRCAAGQCQPATPIPSRGRSPPGSGARRGRCTSRRRATRGTPTTSSASATSPTRSPWMPAGACSATRSTAAATSCWMRRRSRLSAMRDPFRRRRTRVPSVTRSTVPPFSSTEPDRKRSTSAKAPLSVAMALGILLVGCAGQAVPPPRAVDTSPRLRATAEPRLASCDGSGALPAVHRRSCGDEPVAQLDRQLISHYHRLRQELDPVGSMLLTANHRQWLLSRGEQCRLDNARGPDEQAIACLGSLYRKRSREMDTWAAARVAPRPGRNAWTSYVEYRLVDDQDSACRSLEQELNQEVSRHGIPSPARLDGVRMLAGTHARQASAEVGGQRVGVELYNPGVYAGYQNRARSLSVNGQPLLD